ncbi:uncharacterized protein LOC129920593 [Episyrphus balteatus]|uniref:uncharacterized protein LOC129920593 n=1 Tax=Episyrphus balteatus TaxID=286459 RepID=UPI002484F5E4|nr:uncharacterized protein LOC129920593 [Episyrphus balteatus]
MAEKRKETDIGTRQLILKLHLKGNSLSEIDGIVGRTHSTVQKIIDKYRFEGTIHNKAERGRKKTQQDERVILRKIKEDSKTSVPQLTSEMATRIQKPVSTETVRRVLRKNDVNGRVARKKPLISKRRKRLDS